MGNNTKKQLLGVGLGAAGVAVLYLGHRFVTEYLVKIALDRELPKTVEKVRQKQLSAMEVTEDASAVLDATKALEGAAHEEVTIDSHDGLQLVGHWYCPEKPKRVIVAMHGWRSSWSQDFGVIAPFWAENDCAVLYAEQRGQGKSAGDCMGFGLLERYDCQNWAKWVHERTEGNLPIYLCGLSMGATTVLMAASLDLPDTVKGIIADCGFTSPHAIWKHVTESSFRIPYCIHSAAVKDICKQKLHTGSTDFSCADALRDSNIPVLFIHGTEDDFVPVEMTYKNYKACNAPKQLFIVPGAKHGTSYLVDKEGYEKTVQKFWDRYDDSIFENKTK